MKLRPLTALALVCLLLALTGCGTDPKEEARLKLGQMNVKYNEDSFVERARDGDLMTVKLFLQSGMSPNVTDKKGDTALLNASRYGRQEMAQALLAQGADPNVRDKQFGAPPLIWAAVGGYDGVVKQGGQVNRQAGTSRVPDGPAKCRVVAGVSNRPGVHHNLQNLPRR